MTTSNVNGNGNVNDDGNGAARPMETNGARVGPRIWVSLPPALARRKGRTADEALLRARYEIARVIGDGREERTSARALAERLVSRDVELDVAVELARKTLAGGDDPELRLALAGWLEGLGEPALAAVELRKLVDGRDPRVSATLLVRIGVLHARAGDAQGSEAAFTEAAEVDDSDALPLELLGALAGWAPDVISARMAGECYVRAAKRRGSAGESEAELEDLLRAFELDPTSAVAAAALALAHDAKKRPAAADEVLRAHAAALARAGGAADAAEVHAKRRKGASDPARALAAALDEGLDAVLEGPSAEVIDDLLVRAAAYEPLAVRLAMRAERATGRAASTLWAEMGRLLAGPLAATDRALEAYARAVAADATGPDALVALRALADQAGQTTWLVEALLRGSLAGEPAARLICARELASSAEQGGDAALAAWAHAEVVRLDGDDERARAATIRLEDATRRHTDELALARAALQTSAGAGREAALVELARLLRSAPQSSAELLGILAELARAHPEDDARVAEVVRVADRVGDQDAVARVCRDRLARPGPPPRVRIALVRALRRKGDLKAAAEEARGLFTAVTPWAYAIAWIAAAIAGDRETRARAMAAIAPGCTPRVAAVLAGTAAEELAREGDGVGARRAAEQACRADPEDVHALRVLAELIPPSEGRVAVAALERAISFAGPVSALCARLAHAYEQLGEGAQAIGWSRRVVALRPGDGEALEALFSRAARMGDAGALADALAWLVPQPRPARAIVDAIVPALRALSTRDPKRGAELAERALLVLGPRHPSLRAVVEEAARTAGDAALEAKLGELWIAAGAPAVERASLLLRIASHHARTGDTDRELSALARAARAGADLSPARERLDSFDVARLSPDAELSWIEARSELYVDQGRTDLAATAFRELGAALWDTADDRPRAVQMWLRAAQLDSARGYPTLRRDLGDFADAAYATDCLAELVEREDDRVRAGIIATEAARAALDADAFPRALTLARTALERHPGHAEALQTAESACERLGRVQEMSPIYDQVARRALGRFGRRAAHHRAARFFEASGVHMMALKHAAQAFIAVPSEGSTLGLLARTADRAQRRSVAVRTIEHVAELSKSAGVRAAWLLRAASMAARDLEGAKQRVDLLLKAAVLSATPATLGMLSGATRDLLSLAPDETDAIAMRLERASESLAKGLEGPDGARIGLSFAEIACEQFRDTAWAWRAIEQATNADADIEEYKRLLPFADALGHAEGAAPALDRLMASCEKPYSNTGPSLLRLVGAISGAAGDPAKRARALVLAAEKEPDDDEIVAEADEAISLHPDEVLSQRLSKKVDITRRSEALRSVAKRAADAGDAPMSVRFLERAFVLAPGEAKNDISRELKDALLKAGRGEEALLRELDGAELGPDTRADGWAGLARIREERGDAKGATEALRAAAIAAPTEARWAAVEASADASKREDLRVEALRRLVEYRSGADRVSVLKRLARAEGAGGALEAAEASWREIWRLEPKDNEADVALEALLVARADYDEIAAHLARRAERLAQDPAAKETLRAVRLRRAALLEQRLGRLEDAAKELERLLAESPGHPSALRWLADLFERMGQPERALPALDELASRTSDDLEHQTIEIRRVRALLALGDVDRARTIAQHLHQRAPSSLEVLEVGAEVARASGDARELGRALSQLAAVSPEEPRVRSEMLVEAAQAAARSGDTDASLARAREAAKLAPDAASTQLFARGLEYRLRGAGTPEDAEATILSLARLEVDALEPEDVALRAFLIAEAEDVIASGSGELTLRECLARSGSQPLVALAIAERAARAGRFEEALRLYEEAVTGNLLGLRRASVVALDAARVAEKSGATDARVRFLAEAAKDPEVRAEALAMLAEIAGEPALVARARVHLRGLAEALEGPERAAVLAQLGRALFESDEPADRLEADRIYREAIRLAPTVRADELKIELEGFRSRVPEQVATISSRPPEVETRSSMPGPPLAPMPSIPPAPRVMGVVESSREVEQPRRPATLSASIAPRPLDEADARLAIARERLAAGAQEEAEHLLVDALRAGSLEAADMLDDFMAGDRTRTELLTKVRRHAAELVPGDPRRLAALRDAARADQNGNYVRAIEHVMRAFGDAPVAPPPLSAQSAQPGMLALLTRHSREPAGEAFGVVWEGAQALFAKPPTSYGLAGLERIAPGGQSPLSRLYEVALRLLDTPRVALYHRRGEGVPAATITLLASPTAILGGRGGEDAAELRWALGQALGGVLPQNVLPLAMIEAEGHALWNVVLGAFGPPGRTRLGREHAALAEMLWQTLPPRAQRRLKELLEKVEDTPFDLVVARAKQSGRRIGMFLTGDFRHAAQTVVSEARRLETSALDQVDGLRQLCHEIPALADLYRLAIRPEYADARWHVSAAAPQRRAPTGRPL